VRLRGTNQEFGRPYNRRIVLETIRLHAPISRADIARRVGLSLQTVSNIVQEFEKLGFIVARREAPKGRGQPAIGLTLNADGGFAVGLQLSAGGLGGILVDLAGKVRAAQRIRLSATTPEVALPQMAAMVRELSAVQDSGRVLGVGLVMPGPFNVDSMSFVGPTTLEGWHSVPIADRLSSLTGLPAFLGGDSLAAALGEKMHGVGHDLDSFYYVYFGVGLGGGAVIDGQPFSGAWGNAGEFGHIPVMPDGKPCSCGNRGCLEGYVSLHALRGWLREAGIESEAADLIGPDGAGHPVLQAWIDQAVPLLRRAIGIIENLFDPQCIVLGGMLPQPLLERMEKQLHPLLPSVSCRPARPQSRLRLSTLGADSALHGAAVLALSGMLSPRFGLLFAGAADEDEERSLHAVLGHIGSIDATVPARAANAHAHTGEGG
jgi:predicted NBD/HSP70 family sugar kinase